MNGITTQKSDQATLNQALSGLKFVFGSNRHAALGVFLRVLHYFTPFTESNTPYSKIWYQKWTTSLSMPLDVLLSNTILLVKTLINQIYLCAKQFHFLVNACETQNTKDPDNFWQSQCMHYTSLKKLETYPQANGIYHLRYLHVDICNGKTTHISLSSKLVPVPYQEYKYSLFYYYHSSQPVINGTNASHCSATKKSNHYINIIAFNRLNNNRTQHGCFLHHTR